MLNNNFFFNCLVENEINFFTGVPDSLLKNFVNFINDTVSLPMHITSPNEGNSIGLAIGNYLSTGKMSLVYLQNSGLGNIINPLLSLADKDVYGIPMILLIGWRGKAGNKDEPQHFKQGLVTTDMLNSMQVPFSIINKDFSDSDIQRLIKKACDKSFNTKNPFAILVEENTFESYNNIKKNNSNNLLTREIAIETCLNATRDESIIVSTTGKISRELYELRELKNSNHSNDFLTVGGMGHANQIALGIAINTPNKNVYCFDGDGALLMHMGTMALNGCLKLKNYKHIVFNNHVHESVGGQYTSAPETDFASLSKIFGYEYFKRVSNQDDIKKCVKHMNVNDCSSFLEILVNTESRKNLSRPKTTPKENKNILMKYLSK